MKTIKNETPIQWIVRKIGNQIVFTRRKKRKIRQSEKQVEAQKRFLCASVYAKGQMADPERKAVYEKGVKGKHVSAYAVAVTDYLKAPEVMSIRTSNYNGAIGDLIEINAKDDFKVVRVRVVIKDRNHEMIEQGDAIESYRDHWDYAAQVANPCLAHTTIMAIAYDYPGNTGKLEMPCENGCHGTAPSGPKKVLRPARGGRFSKNIKSPDHEITR